MKSSKKKSVKKSTKSKPTAGKAVKKKATPKGISAARGTKRVKAKIKSSENVSLTQIQKENQRLSKQLIQKERELQIEAALEKVRARTMAMQHSNELPEAANLLFQQVQSLGMPAWSTRYCIWEDDKKAITFWMCSEGVIQPPIKAPVHEDPTFTHFKEAWDRGQEFYVEEIGGDALASHYRYVRTLQGAGETLDAIKEAGFALPTFQIFHLAYFTQGFLTFITFEQVPDAWNIFKRFARVFEQTYTRFLDLQKAEAQAKEAKIETALERIRSRSMAMHRSEELSAVISVVSEQLQHLGFRFDNASFVINSESEDYDFWFSIPGMHQPHQMHVPYLKNPINDRAKDARSKGLKFQADIISPEDSRAWHQHMFNHNQMDFLSNEAKAIVLKGGFARSVAFMPNIMLVIGNYTSKPYSDEENAIIRRFATAFEQTYTRFLDLKKAEGQAREAQIEASLERVRSRSMAMHRSIEVLEVAFTIYTELQSLGFPDNYCAATIIIMDKETGDMEHWLAGFDQKKYAESFPVPFFDHPLHVAQLSAWTNGEKFASFEIGGESVQAYSDVMFAHTGYKTLPAEIKKKLRAQEDVVFNLAYMKHGAIMWAPSPLDQQQALILQRFAKVFEQTYTRF